MRGFPLNRPIKAVCPSSFARSAFALMLAYSFLPALEGQPVSWDDFGISGRVPEPPTARRIYSDQRLVEPLEILPGDVVPTGTIARVERDFLICTGADFLPGQSPPPSDTPASGAAPIREFLDVAAFNNATVESVSRAGLDDRDLFQTALERFEAGLASDPQFLPFLYNAGRVAFILGDTVRAARYFERARAHLPAFAGVHKNLGLVYAAGPPGQREEHAALASMRLAADRNPFEREAWLVLGDVYLEWGNVARAGEYYAAVLKEIPASIDAKIGLARIAMAEERWNDARRMLESASLTYPGDIARRSINRSAFYYLGLVYRELGADAQAVESLDRMLSYPRDALFLRLSYSALKRLRDQSAATSPDPGS